MIQILMAIRVLDLASENSCRRQSRDYLKFAHELENEVKFILNV